MSGNPGRSPQIWNLLKGFRSAPIETQAVLIIQELQTIIDECYVVQREIAQASVESQPGHKEIEEALDRVNKQMRLPNMVLECGRVAESEHSTTDPIPACNIQYKNLLLKAPTSSTLESDYVKHGMDFSTELASHRPDSVEDDVDAGLLARSFDQPFNKYSMFTLEYCLTQECGINGVGATMAMRRMFYDYWNSMSVFLRQALTFLTFIFRGPRSLLRTLSDVTVSLAALLVLSQLKVIKIKSDTRGPRNGVKAIIDI
ncbi:hypothetical protein DXG01_005917 [Tephrocybe rancida]|nr:hypothetical protein DXG01_005917 [Tephrocybe rancida]